MPRHKRNKRPFHRINHWLLNAQIGRKNNAFPLPPLFITSANLFYREMKLFLSREQTFFITIKKAKHKLFNNINPYLRKSIPTLCTTKKRPAMTSTNTAKCKNGRFHRILSPIFCKIICTQPSNRQGETKNGEQIKKRLFIVDYSPLFMNKALHFLTRQSRRRKQNLSLVDGCYAK